MPVEVLAGRRLPVIGTERRGIQPAEEAPLAAVAQHVQGEYMLAHPGCDRYNLRAGTPGSPRAAGTAGSSASLSAIAIPIPPKPAPMTTTW
jgi:hypothetical protein